MRMRGIRERLLLSLVLMASVVVAISLPLSNWLIGREFEAFVADKAKGDAHRLELLLLERIDRLRANAIDYGDWGSSVTFIQGDNPTYLDENLYPAVLYNFDVDYVFITDRNGSVRYHAGTPVYTGLKNGPTLQAIAPERLAPILADARVRGLLDRARGLGLVLNIDGRWHMIGASSISYPDGPADRPVHGVLGFASELNATRMARIQALAGVPFKLKSPGVQAEQPLSIDQGNVTMHRILPDEAAIPMAILDIRYPQPLAEQIRTTRRLMLLSSVAIFVIGGVLIWLLVDRGVISRLERLSAELEEVSRGKRVSLTVSARDDEVDRLAGGINLLHSELNRINGEWRHEALHDSLTGLGNRAQLLNSLRDALKPSDSAEKTGLLLIDLDGFKTVNDLYGHTVGDQVLQRVSDRLMLALPPGAQCFRLGGDEFAVLTKQIDTPELKAMARTINASVRADDGIGSAHMLLSASIGVVCHLPGERSLTPGELLQRADIALYSIKRHKRNDFAVFDDAMLEEVQRYNLTLRRLREALQLSKIEVSYQPIVSAIDGRTLSFEALARWNDEELGPVPPLQFVAIAEANFLGAALDQIVLEKAILGLLELRKVAPDATLSVNASVQSLLDPAYVALIPHLLSRAGLKGVDLRLEITESALAANEDILFGQLEALRADDVRIELDDFGTGHSSLGRLVKIQPRGIKLDRSFVSNRHEGGDRVCRAIIGLAQQLELDVTAEGVETEEDAKFLREAHCVALQGYLFAKPQPLAETLAWLRQRART